MKAAVFKGAGKPLSIETIDDPTPDEGEAVIKVQRCGVCGTDLHMTSGHGDDIPVSSVGGHEANSGILLCAQHDHARPYRHRQFGDQAGASLVTGQNF